MIPAFPRARRDDLVIQDAWDELLIYDTRSHHAHCLNATAAAIWRASDGQTSIEMIAARASEATALPCDERGVWDAIEEFRQRGLLDAAPVPPAEFTSRREVMATLGAAAVLVTSILVPTPAFAQSPSQGSQGPQGPQGSPGPQGLRGPQRPTG